MDTRRDFIQGMLAGLGGSLAAGGLEQRANAAAGPPRPARADHPTPTTGSDIGSLYPFIQSQAVHGEFPLSFLRPEFQDLASWKKRARGRLLELLHYSPPSVDPGAEVIARVEIGRASCRERV